MDLNFALWLLGAVGEASVLALLVYRRAWRTLPWFCLFCLWALVGDCAEYIVYHFDLGSYLNFYFITRVGDSALQFCVLVEVAWSVFRPFRASLPRQTMWVLAALMAIAAAAVWPFAASRAFARMSMEWQLLGHMGQTVTILRILFFLILAGCSQLLSIGWRDRELQIATGLGFYSLIAVAVTALQAHMGPTQHYRQLDQLLIASYIGSLAYWAFSFAQKEAERREFSPQMQGLLLAVAGAARSSRIAMTGPSSGKSRTGRDL